MIRLIQYIRSMFCKHELVFEEKHTEDYYARKELKNSGIKVSVTCKKCGYHHNYWKFL